MTAEIEPAEVKKKKKATHRYMFAFFPCMYSNYIFCKKKREARLYSIKKLIEGPEHLPISVISWSHSLRTVRGTNICKHCV